MAQNWYYTKDGKSKNGPVTTAQLKELARGRQLLPTDMVKREDMPKWVPASQVQGLFSSSPQAALPHTTKPVPPAALPPIPAAAAQHPAKAVSSAAWQERMKHLLAVALATWRGWTWKVRAAVGGGAAFVFILIVLACGGLGGPSARNSDFAQVEDVDFSGVDYSIPEVDYSKGPNGEPIIRRRGQQDDPHAKKPYTESGFERNGTFVRHGPTVYWYSISIDKSVLDGDQKFGEEFYSNGKLHGRRVAWYDSLSGKQGPKKFETTFLDDLQHGKETDYYEDGKKKAELYWYKDKKHGPYKTWWTNGSPAKQGAYKDGQEQGKWTYWHENGKLQAEKTYANGKLQGRCVEYHPNDQKFKEETIVNGLNEGQFTQWYENGQKALEGKYRAGKKDGRWLGWHPDGEKSLEGEFDAGKWSGTQTEWYSKESGGNIRAVVVFANGEKASETAYYPATTIGREGGPIGPNHKMYEMTNGRMTQYDVDGSVK